MRRIIDEWLLIEYACVFMPANQSALVEAVSKSAVKLPLEWAELFRVDEKQAPPSVPVLGLPETSPPPTPAFTTVEEIDRIVKSRIDGLNLGQIAEKAVQASLDRLRGRV